MKIEYYASSANMGDTPEHECERFRIWAEEELQKEFPEYDVDVINEDRLSNCWTDDIDREEEIENFCSYLWDSCPWDFE